MMLVRHAIPLLIASVSTCAYQWHHPEHSAVNVNTTSGKIHGLVDEALPHVQQFLGIPYAKPPVGDLRWEPPQVLSQEAANNIVNATQLPLSCPQNPITRPIYSQDVPQFQIQGYNSSNSTSEDCLTLSVWSPTTKPLKNKNYPVIVFIYGGHFTTGSTNVPYQIPAQWVERTQSHIVVSFK